MANISFILAFAVEMLYTLLDSSDRLRSSHFIGVAVA